MFLYIFICRVSDQSQMFYHTWDAAHLGSAQQGSSLDFGSSSCLALSDVLSCVFIAVCLSACFIILSPCRRSGGWGICAGHSYGGGE